MINLLPYTQKNPASIAYKNAQELLLKIQPNIAIKVYRATEKKRQDKLELFLREVLLSPNYSLPVSTSLVRINPRTGKHI